MHDACARGYFDQVKYYVENRQVDVNQRGQPPQRWCPLHCTAFSAVNSLEVARYLIENGAKTCAQDEDGWTALHFAATKGHVELVELLVCSRADHAIKDNDGFTPLHEAARNNHGKVVKLLLNDNADVNVRVVNASDLRSLFKVPRLFAIAMKIGRSPLHWAAANGHAEVVEMLCEAQADVCCEDASLDTPLFMAAANGRVSVIKALINYKADPQQVHESKWNLIHQAAANDKTEVMELLAKDFKLNFSAADSAQHTPLHVAVLRRHINAVTVLLQLGASPNQPGPLNYTPLQYACRWDCRDIAALLIQNKAQVDTADEDGWTPLHWACASDALECVSLLVLAGTLRMLY